MIGIIQFEAQKKRLEDNFGKKFSAGQLELILRFLNHVVPLELRELDRIVNHFISTKKSLPLPNEFLEAARSEVKARQVFKTEEESRALVHSLCQDTGLVWKLCDGIPVVHSCFCDRGSLDEGLLRITKDDVGSLDVFPSEEFKPAKFNPNSISKSIDDVVNWLKCEKNMGRSFKQQMQEQGEER